MGKENDGQVGRTEAEGRTEGKPGAEGGKEGTKGRADGTRTRTAEKSTEGTRSTEKGQSKKLPGLSTIEPKAVEVKIPGAEEAEEKPAKKSHKKKPVNERKDVVQSVENLKLLITVVTELLANKVHPQWHMTDSELNQICDPLSRILARHDMTGKLNEYGDWIALLGAVAMVILPRVLLISQEKKKERKVMIANGNQGPTPASSSPGVTKQPTSGNERHAPSTSRPISPKLDAIPSIVG